MEATDWLRTGGDGPASATYLSATPARLPPSGPCQFRKQYATLFSQSFQLPLSVYESVPSPQDR